jgi:hypothetical protein
MLRVLWTFPRLSFTSITLVADRVSVKLHYHTFLSHVTSARQALFLPRSRTAQPPVICEMAEVPNAFLTGWRALPDKLRFHILRYVLPSGATYNASTFRRWEFRSKNWRKLDSLVYLLLSVKEVNSLVIDTIYGQNTLSLEHELYASGIKLPPIHFKRHV